MRISDWSSDVCSSDLVIADQAARRAAEGDARLAAARRTHIGEVGLADLHLFDHRARMFVVDVEDRKSVVSGKSVSVRVDLGGRRIIKKNNQTKTSAQS